MVGVELASVSPCVDAGLDRVGQEPEGAGRDRLGLSRESDAHPASRGACLARRRILRATRQVIPVGSTARKGSRRH
jgi:hypothetical protein